MNLQISRRNQSIIAIAAVLLVLIALAGWYVLSRPSAPAPSPSATTTPSGAPAQPGGSSSGVPGSAVTPKPAATKDNTSGYTTVTTGKQQTIASTIAGVSFTVPVNSDVSVAGGVLTVRPADSARNEFVTIEKTTGGFSDSLAFIRRAVDGTDLGFNAVYNSNSSADYDPGNNLNPGHIYKIGNRLVSSVPAVYLHITTTEAPARDFYLLWVHTGITNWYIVRSAQGLTPASQTELDGVIGSLSLLR